MLLSNIYQIKFMVGNVKKKSSCFASKLQILKKYFTKTQSSHFSTVRLSDQHRSLLTELNTLFRATLILLKLKLHCFFSLMTPHETFWTQPFCYVFHLLPLFVEKKAHTLISIKFYSQLDQLMEQLIMMELLFIKLTFSLCFLGKKLNYC